MPVSLSQTADLECPQCRTRSSAEAWLIIDAMERPDLAARCRDGSIFVATCPNGHTSTLGAPLLYHERARQKLILALPPNVDEAEARQINQQLVGRLRAELGIANRLRVAFGKADYLNQPQVVSQQHLPIALADDPQAARRTAPSAPLNIPAELRPLLEEMSRLTRLSDMPHKVALCEQALRLVPRENNPPLWAALQVTLGNAFNQNPQGSRADNLEDAIRHYELALQVRTREAFPTDWAMTQNNLANAYSNRIRGERAENLERAIGHYEQALQVYTREAFPEQWSGTQNNLGEAYRNRIRGERAENLERAIGHYEQALQEHTVERWPERARSTARNLARAGEQQADWRAVHTALSVAARAGERLFSGTVSPFGEQTEAQELARLYGRDIETCLRLYAQDRSSARDILSDAEAARARAFLRQMGLGEIAPPPAIPAALVARENALRAELRTVQTSLTSVDARADRASELERTLVERRAALSHDLDQVWDEMCASGAAARDYVALRRGDAPAWDDLAQLAARLGRDAALVEFHLLSDQTLALVWRAGWEMPRVIQIPLTPQRLLHRYLRSYEAEVLHIVRRERARHVGREPHHAWLQLGEELLAPLEPALGDAELVYFIPHGYLHLVPLHALTVGGEPFIARRAVAYAPSAAVLGRVIDLTGFGNLSGLAPALVMGYTEWDWQRKWFVDAAQEIAALFGAPAIVDERATRDELAARAPDASLIHLLCHGLFDAENPLDSAVMLAGGGFTAREWMRLRLRADLVTLSACQLAFGDVNPGDDVVGMTRALLYAGASSVLLALWSVYADTTQEWMLDFYRRTRQDKQKTKARAFREATLALRETHPDPYYWAPFVLVGDWR